MKPFSISLFLYLTFFPSGSVFPAMPAKDVPAVKGATDELPHLVIDDFGWVERDLLAEFEEAIDRTSPRIKPGEPLAFTSLTGLKVDAIYQYASKDACLLKKDDRELTIKYSELPQAERLRIDIPYRVRYIEIEAKLQTRLILKADSVVFPDAASLLTAEEQQEAFNRLNPSLHSKFAASKMHANGNIALGALHARAAARLGDGDAMFLYGALLSQRASGYYNPTDGLMFLVAARNARSIEARKVLGSSKIDSAQMNQADQRYKEMAGNQAKSVVPRVAHFRALKAKGQGVIAVTEFQKVQ